MTAENKTLVVVEHDMGVVFDLADRISVLVYGEIIAPATRRKTCGPTRRCKRLIWAPLWRPSSKTKMLNVSDLHAYYGKSHILQGVNLTCGWTGEIVALLGRNGVGRSTTCKAIMGEVAPSGSILVSMARRWWAKSHLRLPRPALAMCRRIATSSPASPHGKICFWASSPGQKASR